MWGCVRKIEPGLRAYQIARHQGIPSSHYASMARINTKVKNDYLRSLEGNIQESSEEIVEANKQNPWAHGLPKFLLIGGAVAVACTLNHGLVTKAVIFGVARRFGKVGRWFWSREKLTYEEDLLSYPSWLTGWQGVVSLLFGRIEMERREVTVCTLSVSIPIYILFFLIHFDSCLLNARGNCSWLAQNAAWVLLVCWLLRSQLLSSSPLREEA